MKRSLIFTSGLYMLLLCGLCAIAAAQVYEQWVETYEGEARCLVLDSDGNVYVTGKAYAGATTIKYDPAGEIQWIAVNGHVPKAMTIDEQRNTYITGYAGGYDYITMKNNSDGIEQWSVTYNGTGNASDIAFAVAVDQEGNVYVTGESPGIGTSKDYATVKYDSNGVEQWVARYDGPGHNYDQARSIAVDGVGNVYVTGYSSGDLSNDYATIKYDSNGREQWIARYNGPGNGPDAASSLTLDSDGNVYVTGSSGGSGTLWDYATIKYDTDGLELWIARYDGPAHESDGGTSIAVDIGGNVYVTGSSHGINTGNSDYATMKYDSSGSELWVARYSGPGYSYEWGEALVLDADANVYVTGVSSGIGCDYATIKYDASGVEQWVARYNGPANDSDKAYSIAVDDSGNVYVTGTSGSEYHPEYATIRYTQVYIDIILTPVGIPIQIPASGGAFDFDVLIENLESAPVTCDIWTEAVLPNGQPYPIILRSDVTIPASGSILRTLTQNVPAGAPAGSYAYNAYVGNHPDVVYAEDSFPFEKLGVSDAFNTESNWMLFGWEEEVSASIPTPEEFTLHSAHPNPFNPSTTISFSLPQASRVNLLVYDIFGRLVATLINGWRDAGIHEVTFDGSGLASGIYVYRLQAGQFTAGGKMVLMK